MNTEDNPDSEETKTKQWKVIIATLCVFGIAVLSRDVLFAIPAYKEFWQSAPDILRWLENPVRGIAICFGGLYALHRFTLKEMIHELGLGWSPVRPFLFGFIACSPMLVVPALMGGLNPALEFRDVAFGAIIWPFSEEVVFRGYAFHQLHKRGGLGMWTSAIVVGAFFGALHLGNASVQQLPLSGEIGVVLIVSLGGILYAWLFARWEDNLWVPFSMHVFMNLWWSVFVMGETALGGWLPNVLRLATVILAIVLTLKRASIPWFRSKSTSKLP